MRTDARIASEDQRTGNTEPLRENGAEVPRLAERSDDDVIDTLAGDHASLAWAREITRSEVEKKLMTGQNHRPVHSCSTDPSTRTQIFAGPYS